MPAVPGFAGRTAQCCLVFGSRAFQRVGDGLCSEMILYKQQVALSTYMQIAPGQLFQQLQRNLGLTVHDGIYNPRSVGGRAAGLSTELVQACADQADFCGNRRVLPSSAHLLKIRIERSMEELVHKLRTTLQTQIGKGSRVKISRRPDSRYRARFILLKEPIRRVDVTPGGDSAATSFGCEFPFISVIRLMNRYGVPGSRENGSPLANRAKREPSVRS